MNLNDTKTTNFRCLGSFGGCFVICAAFGTDHLFFHFKINFVIFLFIYFIYFLHFLNFFPFHFLFKNTSPLVFLIPFFSCGCPSRQRRRSPRVFAFHFILFHFSFFLCFLIFVGVHFPCRWRFLSSELPIHLKQPLHFPSCFCCFKFLFLLIFLNR